MDLDLLLRAAQVADPTVIGLQLPNPDDPSTWVFQRDVQRINPLKPRTWIEAPPLTTRETATLTAAVDLARQPVPVTPEIDLQALAADVLALRRDLDEVRTPKVDPVPDPKTDPDAVLAWIATKLGIDPIQAALEVASGVMVEKP